MARTAVTDATIDYPDSDGLPLAEHEAQFWPILYVGAALDHHFQARDDVYVVGNLLPYYQVTLRSLEKSALRRLPRRVIPRRSD